MFFFLNIFSFFARFDISACGNILSEWLSIALFVLLQDGACSCVLAVGKSVLQCSSQLHQPQRCLPHHTKVNVLLFYCNTLHSCNQWLNSTFKYKLRQVSQEAILESGTVQWAVCVCAFSCISLPPPDRSVWLMQLQQAPHWPLLWVLTSTQRYSQSEHFNVSQNVVKHRYHIGIAVSVVYHQLSSHFYLQLFLNNSIQIFTEIIF